jgi:seryl-tRNA synthetase
LNINGNGIAFIAWCVMCVLLEIFAQGAGNLWIVTVLWALFGEFKTKEQE